jgi:ATP synthase protein I
LDEVFDTKPIFLLSCGLLGFIGGMQKIQRLLSKMDQLDPPKAKDASEKSE